MGARYKVTDACGQHVTPGSLIYDFRGDHAVFQYVSRPADPLLGTLDKITVERAGLRREFYAHTFALTIEPLQVEE